MKNKDIITSSSNQQIKQIVQLNTKAKIRKETGLFVAEGKKLFLETPKELRHMVYVTEDFVKEHPDLLADASYEIVEEKLFSKICDTKTPQGILTLVRMPKYTMEDVLGNGKKTPFVMVLEDLQDPGNVGTILRTAEGAGVTGVILSRCAVDLFHPKTIRSTMGSIFRVPFYYAEDVLAACDELKEKGVTLFAAHLKGNAYYGNAGYENPTAFLIGNEGNGLTEALSKKADRLIRIPMEGQVESLNAAIASAVLMYEVHRQRNI